MPHLMSPSAGGICVSCDSCYPALLSQLATRHMPHATRLTSSVIYLCATLEPNKRKCQWDTAQMDMADTHTQTHTYTHIEIVQIKQTCDLGLAELAAAW